MSPSLLFQCSRDIQLTERGTHARVNVGLIAGIGTTHSQVGFRNQCHQSPHQMPTLLMREVLEPHTFRPEAKPANPLFLLRPMVPSDRCDLPLDPLSRRKDYAHLGCHPALFGNQVSQWRYLQALLGGWAAEEVWVISCVYCGEEAFHRCCRRFESLSEVKNDESKKSESCLCHM